MQWTFDIPPIVSGLDTKMRAKILIVGIAIACLTQPLTSLSSLAQSNPQKSAAEKPVAPQGRVGSLSPDEARRAERSRKRAAESNKGAPASAERKEAAPGPKRETVEEFRRNRDRAAEPRQPSRAVREREPVERQAARPERRETEREVRRVQRQEKREAQRTEPRRERRARVTSPPRTYAARPAVQRPRVGAYVPRGVPLYPLPRRYGYGPGYGPRFYGPRYVYGPPRVVYGAPYYGQPGPPPFPGVHTMDGGDDDGQ